METGLNRSEMASYEMVNARNFLPRKASDGASMIDIALIIFGSALAVTIIVWGEYLHRKADREDWEEVSRIYRSVCKRIALDNRLEIWWLNHGHRSDRGFRAWLDSLPKKDH
jgi:hypothetical protein